MLINKGFRAFFYLGNVLILSSISLTFNLYRF